MLPVHLEQADAPVLAGGQLLELLPVIGQEVDLLPAGEVAHDVDALLREEHVFHPVDPAVLVLLVHQGHAAGLRGDGIQPEIVLRPVHPADHQFGPVAAPERRTEILVFLRVEVGPDGLTARSRDESQSHFRIRVASLGVAGLMERAVLAPGRIDREHRHLRIVEPVEGDHPAVGRPPEGTVHRGAAEDLLVVHPGGVAVEDQVAAVVGVARHVLRAHVDRIQVVVQREGDLRGVGRPGGIDPARHQVLLPGAGGTGFRCQERLAPVFQCHGEAFAAGPVGQPVTVERYGERCGLDDVGRERVQEFRVGEPFAGKGRLALDREGKQECQGGKQDAFHDRISFFVRKRWIDNR